MNKFEQFFMACLSVGPGNHIILNPSHVSSHITVDSILCPMCYECTTHMEVKNSIKWDNTLKRINNSEWETFMFIIVNGTR